MSEQTTAGLAVRQTIVVEAPRERAFEVFTAQMGRWWRLDSHSIGSAPAVDAIMEPRVGGRWYERGEDGSECDWGRVRVWDPPHRVVVTWEISADWKHDPALDTEVDVTFHIEDDRRTRVELEHRHLEAFGERAQEMRDLFERPDAWGGVLADFAAAAASAPER